MKKLVFSSFFLAFFFLAGNECHALELAKARVIELTGEVRFKNPEDVDWRPVSKDMELMEGASLFVGPNSECGLAFGDDFKSVTHLKQDTRVVLKSISAQPQLELSAGEVFALVRNLKKESSFRVSTPTAVATVRGTAFSFSAEGIGSQMNSTVQVYEHSVGLNPIDQPDKEIPVWEGRGATMGPHGAMEKEFELSPEDFQAGKEFMTEALAALALDEKGAEVAPKRESDTSSSVEGSDRVDQKKLGGPKPPGPDSGGSSDLGGRNGKNDDGDGPLTDTRVDSAMDGVVMGMAEDSEFSKSETFGGSSMNKMFESLADLSEAGNKPDEMDSAMYAATVKGAIEKTDYFREMPSDVQERMMDTVDRHAATGGGPMSTGPEGGFYFDGQTLFTPDGETFNMGSGMDSSLMGPPPPGTFFSQSDLVSFINDPSNIPAHQPQSFINFVNAIRQDYNNYLSSNGGSDAGYYGAVRTITNFNFIRDDVPYTGSVKFTPIDADPSPGIGIHDHGGPDFLHLSNVSVTDDPSGLAGSVVVAPGTIEVPTV